MYTSLPKEKLSVCLKCDARIIIHSSKWNGKHNQHLFNHGPNITPFANKWSNLLKNISNMSADNKLRQFSFNLHRILVTKKELKRYKIKPDDQGRSQPFCIEGFLMYIACPIDNRAPESLFTNGVWGHAANGKVPHQKPGVMVGHLHSTEKRLAQGFLLEKVAKLEVGTGGKTSQHRYWGQSMPVSISEIRWSNREIVSALL